MFKAQTVDTILSTFNKAVADLTALAAKNRDQINSNRSTLIQIEAENVGLSLEADRADEAAGKIKALIG